jgi:hypothetical protein
MEQFGVLVWGFEGICGFGQLAHIFPLATAAAMQATKLMRRAKPTSAIAQMVNRFSKGCIR